MNRPGARVVCGAGAIVVASIAAALAGCGGGTTPAVTRSACFTLRLTTSGGTVPVDAIVSVRPVAVVPPTAIDVITSATVGPVDAGGRACGQASWSTPAAPSLTVTVGHAERAYAFGPFALASEGGACGSSTCQDLGALLLAPEQQLPAAVCTLTGTVRDGTGPALPTAGVNVSDASVPFDVRVVLCSPEPALCQPSSVADANGAFAVRALVAGAPVVQARWTDESDPVFTRTRLGHLALGGCPLEPTVVTAGEGFDTVRSVSVSLAGDQLAWNPGFTASAVQVWHSSELAKWTVEAPTPFRAPATYGRVPPGATQRVPLLGPPAPLEPGDRIVVRLSGTAPDGFPYTGEGQYVVPPR